MAYIDDAHPRRKLKIDLSELVFAFENASWEAEYYLDLETGDIILISSMLDDSAAITRQMADVADHTRYLQIPHADSRDEYRDMERFVASASDPALRQVLSAAIIGKGAFRRFKNALHDYPQERDRWFRFKADRSQQRVLDWLDSHDIELVN